MDTYFKMNDFDYVLCFTALNYKYKE